MTVKELVEQLARAPWNYEVQVGVVSKDAAGQETVDLRHHVELDGFLADTRAKVVIIKATPEA